MTGREPELLGFERVSRRFGARMALLDVSLSLGPGVVGLIGPNGAGKTTWLRLAAGLIVPTSGTVRWCGGLARRDVRLANRIALCPDGEALPVDMTPLELMRTHLRAAGLDLPAADSLAQRQLERMGLGDRAGRPIAVLSRGQRQRVKLALAFALPADLLLLDEPQNALDPVWRAEVTTLCRQAAQRGALVVVSSHILEEVEAIADRLVVIYRGRVVAAGRGDAVRQELGRDGVALRVRCSDARALARALVQHPGLQRLEIDQGWLRVGGPDLGALRRGLAAAVLAAGVEVWEIDTEGDDLTAIFRALGQEVR